MNNRELILDLKSGAFTINDIYASNASPEVYDYVPVGKVGITSAKIDMSKRFSDYRREKFKFLTLYNEEITFSEYQDYSFKDWGSSMVSGEGYNYTSFIITGPLVGDDFALYKQSVYLSLFFDRTETEYIPTTNGIEIAYRSGCTAQGLWDWHGDDDAWSRNGKPFRAYKLRHDLPDFSNEAGLIKYPDDVIITKNKLRGRGRSLSLRFSSEEGKDMKLIGWHIPLTQVDKV